MRCPPTWPPRTLAPSAGVHQRQVPGWVKILGVCDPGYTASQDRETFTWSAPEASVYLSAASICLQQHHNGMHPRGAGQMSHAQHLWQASQHNSRSNRTRKLIVCASAVRSAVLSASAPCAVSELCCDACRYSWGWPAAMPQMCIPLVRSLIACTPALSQPSSMLQNVQPIVCSLDCLQECNGCLHACMDTASTA